MDDDTLLRCATEFRIQRGPDIIYVTRYNNHRRFLADGAWAAMIVAGPTNPWYLGDDGRWRYKNYAAFDSPQAVLRALDSAETLAESYAAQAA